MEEEIIFFGECENLCNMVVASVVESSSCSGILSTWSKVAAAPLQVAPIKPAVLAALVAKVLLLNLFGLLFTIRLLALLLLLLLLLFMLTVGWSAALSRAPNLAGRVLEEPGPYFAYGDLGLLNG